MATEDNHIIRIILEGRDKLTGAFKNARKSFDQEIAGMQKTAQRLSTDIKRAEGDMERFGRRQGVQGRRGFTSIENARQQLADLQKEIDTFKRNNRNPITQAIVGGGEKGGLGDALKGLRAGLQEAKNIQAEIQKSLGTGVEERRQRLADLDEEERARQTIITQKKLERKIDLDKEIDQTKAAHFREQENRKQINDDRAFRRKRFLEDKKAELKLEQDKKIIDIKAQAREITSPLAIERRKAVSAGDEAAVVAIDKARAVQAKITAKRVNDAKRETAEELRQLKNRIKERNRLDKEGLDNRIRTNTADLRSFVTTERAKAKEKDAIAQKELTDEFRAKRLQAKTPTENVDLRERIAGQRALANEVARTDNFFKRSGRTVGLWAGDLKRGISEGRQGLSKFGDEADKIDSRLARIGRSFGRAIGQFGNLVNLRFFLLTSAIQLIGTLVAALATNLVSLISSATLAAASIGTVFAAAAAQALPIVGLIAAAANRIQTVFKAVQLRNTNKVQSASESASQLSATRESAEKLADALYSVKQAFIAVQEAQYQLGQSSLAIQDALQRNKEAVTNLAQTRIDISRGLVDAIFRERDANISLKEAELGVIDAKKELIRLEREQKQNQTDIEEAKGAVREAQQRLEAAKKEADSTEIANAQAQLAVAQQSLSAIKTQAGVTNTAVKEGKLAVDRAKLSRDEAKVENQRAKQDQDKLAAQGVEGNPQVVAARREVTASIRAIAAARHQQKLAQQQVADSFHALKIAQRELKDVEQDRARGLDGQISGQRQLKALLDQLSPSERKLYQSLLGLQGVYRRVFRPITDIIVRAFSRAIDRVAILLKDPKIGKAFTTLANAIAGGIDKLSKFLLTPGFRKAFIEFIEAAAKNLPKVVDIFLNLLDSFIQLAKIGEKPFGGFVDFLDRTTGKLDKFLNNKDKTDKFFKIAKENLDSWISLAAAIGKIFIALGKGSAGSGRSLINDLVGRPSTRIVAQGPGPASGQVIETKATGLTKISEFLDKNPKKVEEFFEKMRKILEGIVKSLVALGPVLEQAFASPGAAKFGEFIIKIVIPGLVDLLKAIQLVTSAILALINIPFVGNFVKLVFTFLVFEKAANRVFPVTQKLTDVLKVLATGGIRAAKVAFEEAFPFLTRFFVVMKTGLVTVGRAIAARAFPLLAAGVRLVGAALKFVFITNPWIAIVVGIIALIVLLDRKFHFLAPTIKFIRKVAEEVFDWIKKNWKLLLAIILGPFTLAAYAIVKWRDKITGVFQTVIDWFKKHWKTIAEIIIGIFTFPLGPIAVAIFKWHDKIIKIAEKVVKGITGWFIKLPKMIIHALKDLPQMILDLFVGLGGRILHTILGGLGGLAKKLGIGGGSSDKELNQNIAGAALLGQPKAQRTVRGILSDPKSKEAQEFLKDLDPKTRKKILAQYRASGGVVTPQYFASGGVIGKGLSGLKKIASGIKDVGRFIYANPADRKKNEIARIQQKLRDNSLPSSLAGFIAQNLVYHPYLAQHEKGGEVKPVYAAAGFQSRGTDTVPAMLTPGEWVLNQIQQGKLAQMLGSSKKSLSDFLFGAGHAPVNPNESNPQRKAAGFDRSMFKKTNRGKVPGFEAFSGPGFTLRPHADENGVTVWFAEFGDKTYGQVNATDASKILASNGQFIPGYLNKVATSHGGLLPGHRMAINTARKSLAAIKHQRQFTSGAVGHVQAFAQGGPVTSAPAGSVRTGNQINQKFEVKTQGETDWNYVMRLGAIHAQESY